jgi:histidinol-phosphate aminotransferase
VSQIVKRVRRVTAHVLKPDEIDRRLQAASKAIGETNLSDHVVVITGSTRGVGLTLARALVEAKASVVVNGRSAEAVDKVVAELRAAGGSVIGVCADISTGDGAHKLISEAVGAFGRVTALINNAAVLSPPNEMAWEVDPADWRRVLDVNLTGAFLCSQVFACWMRDRECAGRIINISSGAGRNPVVGLSPYVVSKFGLEGFTLNLALETEPRRVMVTAIELGSLQTGMSRGYFTWEEFHEFPPPETVIPVFLKALTFPPERFHGRVFEAHRLLADTEAELVLNGPLALLERSRFDPLSKNGKIVGRTDPGIVALDRAENQQGMSPKVAEMLRGSHALFDFSRYPDYDYSALRKALGQKLNLPEDCFTFGNGAAELVERTVRTFARAGEEVVSNDPTWFMFRRFCANQGVINRSVPVKRVSRNGVYTHNLEEVARAVSAHTRMIYLVNPSNPLGNGIPKADFMRFVEAIPAHIPVVVDEAYLEFSVNPETLRSNEIIMETGHRIVGIRTFSKFYGLAGMRIGYAFAAQETIRLFNRLEQLFTLSSIAEAAAVVALQDEEYNTRVRRATDRERKRIQDRLARAGLDFVPSETHFMLVESPATPEKVYEAFEGRGIFVPKGLYFDRYMMFPVGNEEQNERNLDILSSL